MVAILAYFLDGNIIFLMATKSGEGVCYMFLESHPIVATKSSGNQIHFGRHSTRPIEFDKCKQIQSPSSETLIFVFFFPPHHLGLFVLVFWFFAPLFCLFSCFFLPHTPFVLFSYFFHPLPFYSFLFHPTFRFFSFVSNLLFVLFSLFRFCLVFFPLFLLFPPPFSLFLLLALFSSLCLVLPISPCSYCYFMPFPPLPFWAIEKIRSPSNNGAMLDGDQKHSLTI